MDRLLFCGIFCLASLSSSAQLTPDFEDINAQVWNTFCKAFETLNPELMAEIHDPRLMRIPADSKKILGYDDYISGYRTSFDHTKKKGQSNEITLRFFERISNGMTASERGIYRLIIDKGKPEERVFYGQFHVLHTKETGRWKILMDYDSSEQDTIGEAQFLAASRMDGKE